MDIYDIAIVNILEHELWEKRGAKVWKRARRSLQRWRGRVTGWREARSVVQHERAARRRTEENVRMEPQTLERAKARSVIAELDAPFVDALQQELYDKWHDEFVAKARAELEPTYEAKFEQRCERWQDAHAGFKRTVQEEFDNQRELDRERDRRRIREEFTERFETATEAQAQAEQRLAQSDEQLLSLIKSLMPEGKRPFLYDCGIETVDVWGLNSILHRHQLQIVHELTESKQRLVKVRIGESAWSTATRFRIEPYEVPQEPMTVDGIPLKHIVKF